MESPDRSVDELLEKIYPFRFLTGPERGSIAAVATEELFDAGETIFRRGEEDRTVYLLAEGIVEVIDPGRHENETITTIYHNHYFGEWEAIFDESRSYDVRAMTDSRCYLVPGDVFLDLLGRSASFALGFGTILRDDQGVFSAFERFRAYLMQEADRGYIGIGRLLPLYRALQPALHPGASDDRGIDVAALEYAVRRLPDNVTRTFAFLFVDQLPATMHNPEKIFVPVRTTARRRAVWEILPGKDLIVLRTGDSDLIDIVTCLCLYAVEARKIRERLARGDHLERLQEYLSQNEESERDNARAFLLGLPFSSREVDGLCRIWRKSPVLRVAEVARHREMFSIDVRRREQSYNVRRDELWISRVAGLTRSRVGLTPAELPNDRAVHIVSSNTHSVTNCLNPWFVDHSEQILAWGLERGHPAMDVIWESRADQVYAVARDFFSHNQDLAKEAAQTADTVGHARLERTASTGIQVQVIDLAQVPPDRIDPDLSAVAASDDIIVNIDYAFGRQAQYVIRNLLMLYGRNVRSVSFFGKAGALVGSRGDLLIPTAFVEQQNDLFYPINQSSQATASLRHRLEARSVHTGPMLTVDGTLLQNRAMLNFYRRIWGVVGMEMEGTHYFRQILEARQLGVIAEDVAVQFYYYVSDLPMDSSPGQLSAPMALSEGVPPLYAITRHILATIMQQSTLETSG